MWEGPDTLGLISCIAGTVLLVIPVPPALAMLIWVSGGIAVVVMGVVAVAKDSKIGIGGIILGSISILVGFVYPIILT